MLTVIITSYGNRPYLARSIDYWSRSPYKVIIADGSTRPWSGTSHPNINYLHLPTPPDTDPIADYAHRKLIAIESVTTPYVAQCADDDFLAFNGLRRCVAFLEERQDVAATQGWGPWFLHDEFNLRWLFPDFSTKPIEQAISELPDLRMKQILDPFAGIMYAVFRTPVLRDAIKLTQGLTSELMIELSVSISSVITGKFISLPCLYQAREILPSARNQNRRRVDRWMKEPDNTALTEKWIRELAVYLKLKTEESSVEDARSQVQSALTFYTSRLNLIGRRNFINNIPGHLKHAIRLVVPKPLLRIRRLGELPQNSYSEYPLSIDSLPHKDDPISLNEAKADFAEILSSIHKFGPISVNR
ncbi:MAG: TIGR00180 family glycosyltransferase [Acidimicrobiaceae bacterium]|nr:TIGR00180 family glycosyltransferase [Acidimicrobiaceae bacterium]